MKKILSVVLLLAALTLSMTFGSAIAAEPTERFRGYNLERGKWTTGNLGKDYFEGMFVSYQLRIDMASKIWGADEFSISFNFFQASSGAVYVDGFDTSAATGFQYSTGEFLPDGVELPPASWGTPIPTPAAGGANTMPQITNYMNPWPPGTDESAGATPAKEHYFTVKGIPWTSIAATSDHMILFFRAHLTQDVIWFDGDESVLPTQLDGDVFQTWTAPWHGSSFATGSSRHFTLHFEGVGDKTIPIPIVQYPTGMITGTKYVTYCNGTSWVTIPYPYVGWEITLTGTLFDAVTYSKTVLTGSGSWALGYFEFAGLMAGTYTVAEEMEPNYVADAGYPTSLTVQVSMDTTTTVEFRNTYTIQGTPVLPPPNNPP